MNAGSRFSTQAVLPSAAMDLSTFLKPEASSLSGLRAVGQAAPALPFNERLPDGAYVISFLRHIGCPFAELTLLEACRAADEYPDVEFIVVTQGNWGESRDWARRVGGLGRIHMFPDPDRRIFAAWGLGLSDVRHFAGLAPLRAVTELYRSTGIRNRHPIGTRWQTGGAFAVDADGFFRFVHVDEHAGDCVDLDLAVASLPDDVSA